jgi:hypothetical protein
MKKIILAIGILVLSCCGARSAHAQRVREIYDNCVGVTATGNAFNPFTITNNCGVTIRVWYGTENADRDSGFISYSGVLAAGQTTNTSSVLSSIYAIGCDTGYKLTYRNNQAATVTGWTHISSLICVQNAAY